MAITQLKPRGDMSEAEWQTRVDLAMLYRVIARLRMTDLVFTHLSARVPDEPNAFLLNNYGEMFDEVTASSLVKIDLDGNVLDPQGSFNEAGFCIHSAVYLARPDAMCVTHLHTRASIAVSAQADGLRALSQHSLWPLQSMAYHDYEGPAVDLSERETLARDLGDKFCMLLRNHGSLCVGRTIPECFRFTYYLDTACQIQVDATAAGAVREIPANVVAKTLDHYRKRFERGDSGDREWAALRRQIERDGADYAR